MKTLHNWQVGGERETLAGCRVAIAPTFPGGSGCMGYDSISGP